MIQINPLKSYIDGGVRAALTTPPSASLVFDLPGRAIWVKGVKLKGTDHTYTFNHDNYINLTNTPDPNNSESEEIKIGININTLKAAIDTTYGVVTSSTDGLAPKFSNGNKSTASAATTYHFLGWTGTTLKWYQAPWRNIRINSETTDCLGVNSTDPLIISAGNGINVTWDSTNKKIVITNSAPDVNHNTDNKVAQAITTLSKDYPVILKGNDTDNGIIAGVNFSTYLKFNPSTKQLISDGEYYANGNLRLAHISEIPTSLKNPYALTISLNGTSLGPYDGSAAKNINITSDSIGAATSGHNHDGRYVLALGTTNDNIDSDWGQSFKTFDPIPLGTPPELNNNISLLSIGNLFGRRKLLAFMYNNDNIYYRRRIGNEFSTWKKLAFTSDIPTALKNPYTLTFSAGTFAAKTYDGSSAITINIPTHTSHLVNNSGFLTLHLSLANYVTLNTALTITNCKIFKINAPADDREAVYYNIGLKLSSYGNNHKKVAAIGMGNEPNNWYKAAIGFERTNSYDVGDIVFLLNNKSDRTTCVYSDIKVRINANGNINTLGSISASGFIKTNSSDSYVLLGGGGHKAISDFMLKTDELSNNLTTISKSLTVTKDWMDTGIKNTDLPANGTYIIQVSANNTVDHIWYNYWSGIMSWYKDGTDDSDSDEIILHRAGHAYDHTIYLRTIMTTNSDGRHLRLQIAADTNLSTAVTYTFKFKRVI